VSGTIEATNDAGSIGGRNLTSQRATPRLSTGEIDATFCSPPLDVAATSIVGAVVLRVPGNVPYKVEASTTVGEVRVGVTRSPTASRLITASAKTGSVTIEPAQ
jgi:hypothetical protein